MDAGEAIRILRKRDGLSQKELALRLGISPATVKKYEAGTVNLSLTTIRNLCSIFRVAPFAFVYPEAWRRAELDNSTDISDFYRITAIYTKLTDEGKQKLIDYVVDLGDIERYKRKDLDDYNDMYRMFGSYVEEQCGPDAEQQS